MTVVRGKRVCRRDVQLEDHRARFRSLASLSQCATTSTLPTGGRALAFASKRQPCGGPRAAQERSAANREARRRDRITGAGGLRR